VRDYRPQARIAVSAIALCCAAACPAAALTGAVGSTAPTPPGGLHLEDALALALARNWELQSAGSDLAVARAAERTAREWPNPTASFSTSHVHLDGRSDATPLGDTYWTRGYDSVGQLGELIELGGKRGARRAVAGASTRAAAARLADARRTVVAGTVRAYAAAALATANAGIAEQSAAYLRDEARIAAIRLEAGDISRADRDQIEIAAARLELDAESARTAALGERLALEELLGLAHPTGDVVLADSLEALAEHAAVSSPPPAAGERADLVAARAELARATGELRLQRAARIPDPTLTVQAEHAPPDRPNSVGGSVALTVPFLGRNAGAIAGAETGREAAEREVRRVAAQVAADSAAARSAFAEAVARWRRYRDDLRPRSDAIRRAVSLAFERGGASLLDLLEAQRNDNDVRLEATRAANDVAVAAADLAAACSTFTPEASRP